MPTKKTAVEVEAGAPDPYDFANLDGLPEDIANRLRSDTSESATEWARVVAGGAERGYDELNINQIMAAAYKLGMDVPTQQTVRGYLNKAVELRLLTKPSRQSYGVTPKGKSRSLAESTGLETPTVAAEVPPAIDMDPLAGL